jgi:DNA-binding winged helix-turn-helix (wHTH) protein
MNPERGVVRLGRFVFHPASGELTDAETGSAVVRLQPQVAALLSALLERPGTVVSRAELQSRLWPDTNVDFDEGLNYSVRQLRLALGDDASAPRFIETLPRRGYRLIAPVSPVTEAVGVRPAAARRLRGVALVAASLVIITALLLGDRAARGRDRAAAPAIALAVLPFAADAQDSTLVAYRRQLADQVNAGLRAGLERSLVADTGSATHVLSGRLTRRGFSVEVFVQLVRRPGRRHLWADSILDSYAFSGNSTLTGDRIAQSVTRLLHADSLEAVRP